MKQFAVDAVNTSAYAEILPIPSPDGSRLFFSRRNAPENKGGKEDKVDIWYSDKEGDSWGESKDVETYLNNPSYNFLSSISGDGKTILLGNNYAFDGKMLPGPSISVLQGKDYWSFPKKVLMEDFENENNMYHFNLSRDGANYACFYRRAW